MFKKISRMSIKVTNFCNLDCVYCHQLRKDKDDASSFQLYDELEDFLNKCIFESRVPVTIAGGEISLQPKTFEVCVRHLSSLNCSVFAPNVVTNGSGMKNIIKMIRKGYMRPDAVNLSWDGIHSYSQTRHGKKNIYSDELFNRNLKMLADFGLGDSVAIVIAVTPYNVKELYDSVLYALNAGMKNFYFYLIHEAKYQDAAFLASYKKQAELIADEFVRRYDTCERFKVYNYQSLYTRMYEGHDFLSDITCKKLGASLHFDMNGDIYPCLYFGDHRAFQIGNLKDGGLYLDRLEAFSQNFLRRPDCLKEDCGLRNCFECPASNYVTSGEMQEKRCNGCGIRMIEMDAFNSIIERISITDFDRKNFWHDEDSLNGDHMLHKKFEVDKLGVPLAFSESHKKKDLRIASENEGRVSQWL